MTERMLADASAAYPFNYGALRYFNVAGADPEGRAGQIGKGSTHLIKVAVEAAVGKRDHVDVFGTDYPTADGTCVRDYIHVSDLAAAHVAALERLIERPDENLVLNCGYGTGLSVLEVLDAVDRVNGAPVERRMAGRRAGDPPALVASNAALLETLDWRPRYADIDTIVSACARVGAQAADPELDVRLPLLGLAALLLGAAPPPAADSIPPTAVRAHVEFLASDLLEGRDTGSRGHAHRRQLRRVGVSPARPEARRDQRQLVRRRAVPPSDLCRAAGDQPDRQWPQDAGRDRQGRGRSA